MKNILVTGGAGFIGSSFVGLAVEKGFNVVIVDKLTYAGHVENIQYIDAEKSAGSYKLVIGDISDKELIDSLLINHNIDAVLNFAAESHVDNSIANSHEFIVTNINGTHNLLECCRNYYNKLNNDKKNQFRYIQISTDEVYGSLKNDGTKFDESFPMRPNSPYSASKAAADHLVRAWYQTYGLPTIVTNCSNNYGPRQMPEKLIPKIITCAVNHQTLPIYGDGNNIRDWIHVNDHCSGVMLALQKGQIGQTYCLGGNAEKTNIDVVENICQILQEKSDNNFDYKSLIKFVADRAGHDRRYAINDQKATIELGFKREYNFDVGLRQTVSWYLENNKWYNEIIKKAS
ncbi:MAG: dTDP-glucose 4,6-dehydratase [Pseudomonadota bacterium]